MRVLQLKTQSDFINPIWYNKIKQLHKMEYVVDGNKITVEGENLLFVNGTFPTGSVVIFRISRNFECYLKSEYEQELKLSQEANEIKEELRKVNSGCIRIDAEKFNSGIKLPIKWATGRKDVLSGLSENSWGDGNKRNTVVHVLLQEDFKDGNLKRNYGDFLCTSSSRSNGKNWSNSQEIYHTDGYGNQYQPKVTCRACLKLLKKYMS